jgi:molybdopterin-guanine dinucleotide biosynthesis protein
MVRDRVKDKSKHKATLDAVMGQAVPLRHKTTGDERYTTQAVQQAHNDLEAAYRGMAGDRIGAIATAVPDGLTPDQRMAFEYATGAGGKLRLITGVPGAGKTHLLDSIADAYRAKGFNVRAVSVANSAVEVLRQDTTIPARSVCAEVFTWATDDKKRLGPKDLLIIDEVSTLVVEWARDVIVEARKRGAVVLETGDDKQFQAVAYGDALGMARTIEPGVDMTTTMRQKTEWQARATEDLRAGRIREALDAYHVHGHIQLPQTVEEARDGLVTRWMEIERDGVECGVETMRNEERCELSPLLRNAHDQLGRLHGPEVILDTMDGPTPYRAGERVVARDTIREAGLKNGSVVTVKRVQGSILFVERRDKQVVPIDTRSEHGSQIQHAYAHTEYREQGKNRYAELQMVDSLVHQRSRTVGMTRHTHRYEMWAPLEKVQSYANLIAFGERERNKLSLDDYDIRDLAAEQRETQAQEQAREVADAARAVFQDVYRRAVIGELSVPDTFTVERQSVPAGQHTIIGSINGDVLYDAAIVYDTGITDPETGKNVRFAAPLSIAALEEAQRTGSVQIAEPHRPMVDQAIGKVRAERVVAQEREAQRLRDEIMRQAQEQKQSPIHGRSR